MGVTRMKTGVFLQARLNSTRLPRKALLSLEGRSVTERAMDALSLVDADVHALLTDEFSAEELGPLAAGCGFETFAGPEDDVLGRYALAVHHFGVDRYFRATGDNPLVSAKLAEDLLDFHTRYNADFSGFLGPPLGTGVEITESKAILAAFQESDDAYEREHVSPFIYRRPERFKVLRPWAPNEVCLPSSKVTIDTLEDYEELTVIFKSLYRGRPIETAELVAWLKNNEGSHEEKSPNYPVHSVCGRG